MKTEDLIKVWNAPYNSRLTPKQMSIRLPIHVAASISAFAEMYPRKTKTEIIGDLLATAIDQFVEVIPAEDGKFVGEHPDTGEKVYDLAGDRARFYKLKQKYVDELEKEIEKK